MNQKNSLKKNEIISASEISQYTYCSISWYLQRCGYESNSPLLNIGRKAHINFGKTIENIQIEIDRSKRLALTGYLLVTIGIIMIIFGVFLYIF